MVTMQETELRPSKIHAFGHEARPDDQKRQSDVTAKLKMSRMNFFRMEVSVDRLHRSFDWFQTYYYRCPILQTDFIL